MGYRAAYTKIYFHTNHVPEYMLFDGIPGFDVTFVGYTGEKIPGSGVEFLEYSSYHRADFLELLPYSLTKLVMRQPPSTVSFVVLQNLPDALTHEDIVISAELYSFITHQCARMRSRRKDKRLVTEVWETIPSSPIHFIPSHCVNVVAARRYTDIFIAHTERAKQYLKQLNIPNEKITVVYPGLDLKLFHPLRKKNNENFRILFVGRFDREKGLSLLLQAFSQICKIMSNVELWIRAKKSTGETLALAERIAKKYPVKFLNFVEYTKLPELYNQCNLLCLTSCDLEKWGMKIWEEQFGFVLMEAMACGLPVIASDCGSIPEVIGRENDIIHQNSVDDLYTALCQIISDEDHRNYLSKLNRARAEDLFDVNKQKLKLKEAFESVLPK